MYSPPRKVLRGPVGPYGWPRLQVLNKGAHPRRLAPADADLMEKARKSHEGPIPTPDYPP